MQSAYLILSLSLRYSDSFARGRSVSAAPTVRECGCCWSSLRLHEAAGLGLCIWLLVKGEENKDFVKQIVFNSLDLRLSGIRNVCHDSALERCDRIANYQHALLLPVYYFRKYVLHVLVKT